MDDISAGHSHSDNNGLHDVAAARSAAGSFAAGSSSWNGIRANLAEMERKLGELQQQVDPARSHPSQQPVGTPQLIAPAATPAAYAQVVQVKQQIEDLLRVRELLRDSLQNTIGECQRMLGQLDRRESASPSPGTASAAPANGSTAPAGIVLRPSVFQGSVSLRVGPLNDISQVDTLEIALLQVPGAEQVEVKEFSGRDAVAEIRLFQPVRLVEELHRVLPFSFEVTDGDAGSLTLLAGGEPLAPGAVNQTLTAAR